MKQVYLTEHSSGPTQVFSSKWKAIAHLNRVLDKPEFKWTGNDCVVWVDDSTVGWITKKMVQ